MLAGGGERGSSDTWVSLAISCVSSALRAERVKTLAVEDTATAATANATAPLATIVAAWRTLGIDVPPRQLRITTAGCGDCCHCLPPQPHICTRRDHSHSHSHNRNHSHSHSHS